MERELVSIVLPTYNRENKIKLAIESVLNQTYTKWELIIVDDASEDNTEELIKQIEDARIYYLRNEVNRGANYARNRGAKCAKGKFIAFLDSDNCWKPDKLEKQVSALEAASEDVALVFAQEERIDGKNVAIVPSDRFDIDDLNKIMRESNVIDTNVVLMKKQIFEFVGGFDPSMPRLQDYDLFFRIIVVHKYKAIFIKQVLDRNELQQNSISRSASKYQEAALMFLKKYSEYLTTEQLLVQLYYLYIKAELNYADIRNMVHKFGFTSDESIEVLMKYFNQTWYYETLFAWKEKAERQKQRTIFPDGFLKQYKVIALYGLGRWGEAIYQEMENVGIKVSYGIDRKIEKFHDISVVKPNQIPSNIDIIIVSPFQEYKEIYSELSKEFKGTIISIETIIKSSEYWCV